MKLPEGEEYGYHFCMVRRLTALLRKCEGKEKRVVCCSYCPAKFYNKIGVVRKEGEKPKKGIVRTAEELRVEHELVCQQVTSQRFAPQEKLPAPGKNILKFRGWGHLFKNPMFGTAIFLRELTLPDTLSSNPKSSRSVHPQFIHKLLFNVYLFHNIFFIV